jgi:hypothetical protein
MRVTLEKGIIGINAADLVEALNDDDKRQVIETLSCDDAIIAAVASQIVDGWTEAGYHGYTSYSPKPSTALDLAKRYCAEGSSEVAKEQIRRLESMAESAQTELSKERTLLSEAHHRIFQLEDELRAYRPKAA